MALKAATAKCLRYVLAIFRLGFHGIQQQASAPPCRRANDPRSTDWLTGLRGLASLAVFHSHVAAATYPGLLFAHGFGPAEVKHSWLKLPLVRLLYGGNSAVGIFFVVSGCAIAHRPLRRAAAAQWDALFLEAASSAFRRPGRLLIPALVSALLAVLLAQAGLLDGRVPPEVVFAITARSRPSWAEQADLWLSEAKQLLRPWERSLEVPMLRYGVQLWTIPLELWCSFVLYLHILALAPLRPLPRRVTLALSMCYHLFYGGWDVFLFLAGMMLADLQLERDKVVALTGEVLPPAKKSGKTASTIQSITMFGALFLGLSLLSQPEISMGIEDQGGLFNAVMLLVPPKLTNHADRFWIALGAPLTVFAIGNGPDVMRWVFRTRVAQHLGVLSFGLYLVHNMVIRSLGAWWWYSQVESQEEGVHQAAGGVMAGCIAVGMSSLLAASVFYRFIDEPANRFTRWTASRLSVIQAES